MRSPAFAPGRGATSIRCSAWRPNSGRRAPDNRSGSGPIPQIDGTDRIAGAVRGTGPSTIRAPLPAPARSPRPAGTAQMKHRSSAPGTGRCAFGLELAALHMQVDFLLAEHEGLAALAEGFQLHAQQAHVEVHAGLFIGGGQNDGPGGRSWRAPPGWSGLPCFANTRTLYRARPIWELPARHIAFAQCERCSPARCYTAACPRT